MSSINLNVPSQPVRNAAGVAFNADRLEVKKGSAGLEVIAHGADGGAAENLEVTPELRAFLEAVGVRADTDFAALDMLSINASVLSQAAIPTGIPTLQA